MRRTRIESFHPFDCITAFRSKHAKLYKYLSYRPKNKFQLFEFVFCTSKDSAAAAVAAAAADDDDDERQIHVGKWLIRFPECTCMAL